MDGFAKLFDSSKGSLAFVGIVAVTVLAGIGKIDGETALATIVALSAGYSVTRAWTDRAVVRK